jgi:hypothetical protein
MTKATAQIASRLAEIFAALDAEVLAASQEWAKGRKAALTAFRDSDDYQAMRRDTYKLYAHMFALCGGKTWYQVFNGNSAEGIAAFVEKNCAATVAKRNALIARKLEAAAVTDLISEEIAHTRDGFNGFFVVNTDAGRKTVRVDTIRAGGYNIQCLHLRVLVKVK